MIRKYPIGLQSFREIRGSGFVYIDKTEIIHRMVETGKYYFLSRPRRFGKSLLVDTLEELFKGSKALFEGLWIENQWDWSQTNPVIHFNFAEIPYKEVGLGEALAREVKRNAGRLGVEANGDNIKDLFRELIERTATAHGQVILLIDEYDKPLIDFLGDPAQLETNRSVMKTFYSVLKGRDEQIRFMLLTGVSRFAKVSLFSDINHLSDITLIEEFNDVCGITQAELESVFAEDLVALAEKRGETLPEAIAEVKRWYNGYSWGGENTLYNPFSLLSVLRFRQFVNYWIETGTPGFFADMIHRNPGLKFPDGEVEMGAEGLVDLFALKTVYGGVDTINPATILFQTGYLTVKGYDPMARSYLLDYPNLEVRESMQVFLLSTYSGVEIDATRPSVLNIARAFRTHDLPQVMKLIDTLFVNIPNTLWTGAGERFYHAIIQTAFGLLDILMESERNYAGMRPDITVFTKTHIYVLEFKRKGSAEEALAQIIDKDYFRPFQLDGRRKVAIGIKFDVEKKAIAKYLAQEITG